MTRNTTRMSGRASVVMTIAAVVALTFAAQACGDLDADQGQSGPGESFQCGRMSLYQNQHMTCSNMDAVGDGACYCFMGYAWNGQACVGVNGCQCKGADCGKLAKTLKECEAAHKACASHTDEEPDKPLLHLSRDEREGHQAHQEKDQEPCHAIEQDRPDGG